MIDVVFILMYCFVYLVSSYIICLFDFNSEFFCEFNEFFIFVILGWILDLKKLRNLNYKLG